MTVQSHIFGSERNVVSIVGVVIRQFVRDIHGLS